MLTGEERVAVAADLDAQIGLCGARLPGSATGSAMNRRLYVFGVNFRLHFPYSLGTILTFLRPSLLYGANFTLPVARAKMVWSRPIPTFVPGCTRVPRCRTMIVPGRTSSPSKRLTPSRLDWESRPFLALPPLFLCAMLLHSPLSVFFVLVRRADFAAVPSPASGFASVDGCEVFRGSAGRRGLAAAVPTVVSAAAVDGGASATSVGLASARSAFFSGADRLRGARVGLSPSVLAASRPWVRISRMATRV